MLCLALLSAIANLYGDVIIGVARNHDDQSSAVFPIDSTTGATRKVGFSGEFEQSQGIASSSPRLARQRLPWVIVQPIINRNAVVANVPCDGWKRTAATALRLGRFGGR
jgi:hypothetical protein